MECRFGQQTAGWAKKDWPMLMSYKYEKLITRQITAIARRL